MNINEHICDVKKGTGKICLILSFVFQSLFSFPELVTLVYLRDLFWKLKVCPRKISVSLNCKLSEVVIRR